MTEKKIKLLGRVASVLSILMYVSYIPQIINNLNGSPGSSIQPFVAMINCSFWSAYGLLKKEKEWSLVLANIPGIFLGAITFITSF